MRKACSNVLAALLAASSVSAVVAQSAAAEDGRWMIRGRVIGVLPDEGATIDPINGDVDIGDQYVPELDFTYFFNDQIAVELIAAVTPHDVTAIDTDLGDVDLGDVWLLPPTLTLQYHFNTDGVIKPYVGAGINYTHFFNEELPSGSGLAGIEYDSSFGWALQAGVDYKLNENWHLNFDVKKIDINTDVTIDAGALGVVNADVDIDPWVIGVGLGYRF